MRAELSGIDVSEDGKRVTFQFAVANDATLSVDTSSEFLEQTTALLASAFFSKKQRDGGDTVERGIHWAKTPVAHVGPPAVATSPMQNETVLIHAYGGPYQTAYALSVEQTEKLIQDLKDSADEIRSGIVRL